MTRTVPLLLWFLAVLCGSVQAEDKFPFAGVVNSKILNVRAGQNENFEKIDQLKQGDQVVVVGRSFTWYKIKLPPTAQSYVNAEFVKELSRNIGRISANRLNIRAGAGTNYSVLGQLQENQLVRIIEKKDQWFQIEPVDESYGWVLAEHIQFQSEEIPPPRQIEIPDAPGDPATAKRVTISDIFRKPSVPVSAPKEAASSAAPSSSPAIATEKTQVSGMVISLGDQAVPPNVRHKIVVDDKTEYYLLGYRQMIDGFLNQKVSVEGLLQKDIKAPKPVLLVTKIKLFL